MLKPAFHVLILDGCVAAVGGFLHRKTWCWANENKHTHTHTNSQISNTTVWTVTDWLKVCLCQKYRTHTDSRTCRAEPPPLLGPVGWGGDSHPHGSNVLNTEGQCETRERLLSLTPSHATGGTRINVTQTLISLATQASATSSTTHKKTTSGRGEGGGVYLDSIYRVMDDSSLRFLEEEWRESMKEKRECGVAKWEQRDEWEFFKSVQ